ncbi:MAG: hypothetical protein JRI70_10970 [Deltaproteobacteria bacterium]|nr:hypothetical protein [Deltaproteobacteria bacterium]
MRDGSEIGTSPFELFEVNAGDTVYADGKLYSRSLTLDTKGNYTYYFETQAVKSHHVRLV